MGSKVDVPATTDPTSTDWQNFIAWVEKAQTGKINITFSNMDNTSEPKIQAGSIVEIAGSLYSFSAEEAATGWGDIDDSTQAYMALTASGDTVSAEWTTTAPVYRDDLQGWYESGTTKRYVLSCYKLGEEVYTQKIRMWSIEYNQYNDGTFINNNNFEIDLGGFGFMPLESINYSFSAPSGSIFGMTYDSLENNLISCDSGTNLIYIHDGVSSTILSSFASPGTSPTSLAYDKSTGNLISCDAGTDLIYIHDGVSSTILDSFASPDTKPTGLTYDISTGNLISCDNTTNLIYIHDGVSSTILDSFASPQSQPTGLTYEASTGNLISINDDTENTNDKIYVHNGISSTILTSFSTPSTLPYGLAYDLAAGRLISGDDDTNNIYVHNKEIYWFES